MAITITPDSATIGTTEWFLASDSATKTNQTTVCVLQVLIDFGALAAGDEYQITLYTKINAVERTSVFYVKGVQGQPFIMPSLIVGEGWEVGVKKLAGTDRSIGWSLRKAA